MADTASTLTLATFLMSPGFGGLCAVIAGALAYAGVRYRAGQDRKFALEEDARQRWWDALQMLWESRDALLETNGDAVSDALYGLERLVTSEGQSVMLEVVSLALFPETSAEEQE